ncbi:MAG: response regulator transcription factor [Hamadaea sp.]|nr:response regulator transcription factor [Hamadaea sp.]
MRTVIRTLIVDDEPPARQRLRDLLGAEADVAVVAECATAAQALDAVGAHVPDLVFLDVRMPGGDGFAVAERAGPAGPLIVMVSAFGEHALRAFDVRALDYLMKPFSRERLGQSLDRARERLGVRAAVTAPLQRLPVDVGKRIRLVDTETIDCLRADGNYVRVHAGQSYLVRDTLAGLCARLDGTGAPAPAGARSPAFVRVHRSAAVRVDQVREVETLAHGEYVLRLASGCSLISGRRYRDAVRAALGLL